MKSTLPGFARRQVLLLKNRARLAVFTCVLVALFAFSSKAAALTIDGGPTNFGTCNVSGNPCQTAGATVTCTGLAPNAVQDLYYGIRNDQYVIGNKLAGTAGPAAGIDQFKNATGSISYTGTTTIHNALTGTNNAVNTKLVLAVTTGATTVVATGGNPGDNSSGDIGSLFRVTSTSLTVSVKVQAALSPTVPSAGSCDGLFDPTRTGGSSIDQDISHVDLGFYYRLLATPTPTFTPTITLSPSQTATDTPTATPTETLPETPTAAPTDTPTQTPTETSTETPSVTGTISATATPTATPSLTPLPGCPDDPGVCSDAGKSKVSIAYNTDPNRYSFAWKWGKGVAPQNQLDFGNPVSGGTGYWLCLYDYTSGTAGLKMSAMIPGGGTCGVKPCWQSIATSGWAYKDKAGTNAGILKMKLKGGVAGAPSLQIAGKHNHLPLPAPLSSNRYFNRTPSVVLQLYTTTGDCWESSFSSSLNKNDGNGFKAKAP